jgi:hypothetical protein
MNGTGLSTGFLFFIGACLLITETDDNHPSIKAIKENKTESDQFILNPINEEFVNKEINKIGMHPYPFRKADKKV